MVKYRFIGVKFPERDAALIIKISNARGENTSNFIRIAVKKELARLSFLSSEEKKALEIKGA